MNCNNTKTGTVASSEIEICLFFITRGIIYDKLQHSWYPDRGSNPGPPEYETKLLSTKPRPWDG